jgi:putative addiction module killer protein
VGIEVQQTAEYRRWFDQLVDGRARAQIDARVRRLTLGSLGDWRVVGGAVSELRIDYGPGYRVYFAWKGLSSVVLLTGGDKRSQRKDVKRAQELARWI